MAKKPRVSGKQDELGKKVAAGAVLSMALGGKEGQKVKGAERGEKR